MKYWILETWKELPSDGHFEHKGIKAAIFLAMVVALVAALLFNDCDAIREIATGSFSGLFIGLVLIFYEDGRDDKRAETFARLQTKNTSLQSLHMYLRHNHLPNVSNFSKGNHESRGEVRQSFATAFGMINVVSDQLADDDVYDFQVTFKNMLEADSDRLATSEYQQFNGTKQAHIAVCQRIATAVEGLLAT